MNREDLYRSFNNIDDDILERSEANKKRLSYTWKKWGAIAACLCILVIGAISILNDQSGIECFISSSLGWNPRDRAGLGGHLLG